MKDKILKILKNVYWSEIDEDDAVDELINLMGVSDKFSADQMEQAYINGQENEQQRCGYFDIENYR